MRKLFEWVKELGADTIIAEPFPDKPVLPAAITFLSEKSANKVIPNGNLKKATQHHRPETSHSPKGYLKNKKSKTQSATPVAL